MFLADEVKLYLLVHYQDQNLYLGKPSDLNRNYLVEDVQTSSPVIQTHLLIDTPYIAYPEEQLILQQNSFS